MKISNVGTRFTNLYLLPTGKGYCLIDAGNKFGYADFKKSLAELHLTVTDIHFVVITHAHADHVGFLKELCKEVAPIVIFHPKSKARLEAGKNNLDVFVPTFGGMVISWCAMPSVDKYFCFPSVNTEKFVPYTSQPLSEYGIELVPLSGHTDADLAIKVGCNLFCGDICSNAYPGSHHMPIWLENKYGLLASWDTILKNKEISTIYPSHGKPFDVKELFKSMDYWREKGVFKLFKKKRNQL